MSQLETGKSTGTLLTLTNFLASEIENIVSNVPFLSHQNQKVVTQFKMESKSAPPKNTMPLEAADIQASNSSLWPADATVNARPVKLPPFGQVTA